MSKVIMLQLMDLLVLVKVQLQNGQLRNWVTFM